MPMAAAASQTAAEDEVPKLAGARRLPEADDAHRLKVNWPLGTRAERRRICVATRWTWREAAIGEAMAGCNW